MCEFTSVIFKKAIKLTILWNRNVIQYVIYLDYLLYRKETTSFCIINYQKWATTRILGLITSILLSDISNMKEIEKNEKLQIKKEQKRKELNKNGLDFIIEQETD